MNAIDFDAPPEREELQGVLRSAVDAVRAIPPPNVALHRWEPDRAVRPARAGQTWRRIVALTAAAAVLVGVWLGVSNFTATGPGANAFAQTLEQIQKAKTITWTDTLYCRITSKDGQRYWYEANVFKFAYKAPGLYRETRLDRQGNVESVEITDVAAMKVLTLYPATKTATLSEERPKWDMEGPFRDARQAFKDPDLQFLEKRKTSAGEVNVFRLVEGQCFFDYWVNQKSKQLIEYHINQNERVTLADYENDPRRDAPPEKETSGGTIVGSIENQINYDAELDDSLFRLDVPEGYTVETCKRHRVTEEEMLDFVRMIVEANAGVFPDHVVDIPSELYNKYDKMPKADRSPEGQKLLDTARHYDRIRLRSGPVREFFEEIADWDSFRYFGNGAKLGDKDRIVCWYKLKHAKAPRTYRVVYGDLSVKDVAPEDLPLPVQP